MSLGIPVLCTYIEITENGSQLRLSLIFSSDIKTHVYLLQPYSLMLLIMQAQTCFHPPQIILVVAGLGGMCGICVVSYLRALRLAGSPQRWICLDNNAGNH